MFNGIKKLRLLQTSVKAASNSIKYTSNTFNHHENKRFSLKTFIKHDKQLNTIDQIYKDKRDQIDDQKQVDNLYDKYKDTFFQTHDVNQTNEWCHKNHRQYPDFSMKELKDTYTIIQLINNIKNQKYLKTLFEKIIAAFLNDYDLTKKFLNSENWKIFTDNIHSEIFDDLKDRQLFFFSTLLMRSILEDQNRHFKTADRYLSIADSFNSFYLKQAYSISSRYFIYLFLIKKTALLTIFKQFKQDQEDLQKLQIQNTEIIYFIHYQFIICNYLDHQIRINRGMLNQTQEFKEKLNVLDTYTNVIMKTFNSLDEVPQEIIGSFYRFFSYNKSKFINSTNYLMSLNSDNENSKIFKKVLTHSLKGIIKIFKKVFKTFSVFHFF